jgi:hypothetical protein
LKTNPICQILFIFFCSIVIGQEGENELIKYNGLYETKCELVKNDVDGVKGYLRFYPNGKIISTSTICDATPEDVKSWLNLNMDNLSLGKYQLKNRKIVFYTTSTNGTVNYKGKINRREVLRLSWKSLINGNRGRGKYMFTLVGDFE